MNIFEEVKKLNLPKDKYVVVGSGIMTAYGLKEARDIDIVVTEDLFEQMKQTGEWKEHLKPNGGPGLVKGDVELYLDVNCGNHNPKTEDLIKNAEIVEGVPFISLEELLKFKKEYKRPKDFKDIEVIENCLKNE